MKRVLHVSDLHFGRDERVVVEVLVRAMEDLAPDVLVVSGDLTQRGRQLQFEHAAAFLGKFRYPQIIVPGNHDGAYFNPIRRLFYPLRRYQQYISDDLFPVYTDDGLHIVGVNSSRPLAWDLRGFWKNGSLSNAQLQRLRELMACAPAGACRTLVVHHPIMNPDDDSCRDCIRRRPRILEALGDLGIELVLSGHLHHSYARLAPVKAGQRAPVCAAAGTALSSRRRRESNAFNVISVDASYIDVTPYTWTGVSFIPTEPLRFPRAMPSPHAHHQHSAAGA
jgi:3',5'-cyclic AMP phosphodiesterase CpdA